MIKLNLNNLTKEEFLVKEGTQKLNAMEKYGWKRKHTSIIIRKLGNKSCDIINNKLRKVKEESRAFHNAEGFKDSNIKLSLDNKKKHLLELYHKNEDRTILIMDRARYTRVVWYPKRSSLFYNYFLKFTDWGYSYSELCQKYTIVFTKREEIEKQKELRAYMHAFIAIGLYANLSNREIVE